MKTCVITSFAVAFLVAASANAGVIGYWNFDDTYANQSGPASDGAVEYGTPTFSTDVAAAIGSGKSGSFDGASAIAVPTTGDAMGSSTFTLSYFVKAGTQTGIFERITARDGNSFFTSIADGVTQLGPAGPHVVTSAANRELSYWATSSGVAGGNDWFGWDNTGSATGAGWSHVAWVHDGSDMKLYIDGSLVYTGGSLVSAPSGRLYLGGNATNNGESYTGLLDDVLLTDDVMSQSDLAFIAANGVDAFLNPASIPAPAALPAGLMMIGAWAARRRR